MSHPKKLTPEKKAFIKSNYKQMNNVLIGQKLGLSKTAIYKYLKKEGLERTTEEKTNCLKGRRKPYQKRKPLQIDLMIAYAKEIGYRNYSEARADLGKDQFKKQYLNQLNQTV